MITSMHIENFKCFKDFDIDLGPFNVLVGPNDSGKTAFLQAVAIAGETGPNAAWNLSSLTAKAGLTPGVANLWRSDSGSPILIQANGRAWQQQKDDRRYMEVTSQNGTDFRSQVRVQPSLRTSPPIIESPEPRLLVEWMHEAIGSVSYFAFDPNQLRKATPVTPGTFRMTRVGLGLPMFLADIRDDIDRFSNLQRVFNERFHEYEQIMTPRETVGGKTCQVLKLRTRHGDVLPAESVSDGVILYLAYMAVCYQPDPPKILMIEEPETGVHYASLKQIVQMLKDLSRDKQVQVILTTHSPYLLDCVEPEEVRVFAKGPDGAVRAVRLSDHPEVAELKKHLMTGEIWTEFDELEIVNGQGSGT